MKFNKNSKFIDSFKRVMGIENPVYVTPPLSDKITNLEFIPIQTKVRVEMLTGWSGKKLEETIEAYLNDGYQILESHVIWDSGKLFGVCVFVGRQNHE